ncbi:MAG: elongation factor P [Candidatus Moraniibacteriota bacterium]|nr:MAG: elongation factor P [Candidatus Moranbacteria bacterium]
MLSLSQIKAGKNIIVDNQPYTILTNEHSKMGRAGAVMRTKLKSLITGFLIEKTFQGADKVDEADISKSKAQYLYTEEENLNFMDMESYEQFSLPKEAIGTSKQFLLEGTEVDILQWNGQPINVELPVKVTLLVTDAPPGIKGDTASGGDKVVTLETGATLTVPLFVKSGDKVIINTQTGYYVSRA